MRHRNLLLQLVAIAFGLGTLHSALGSQPKHTTGAKGVQAAAVDVMLDGNDWRMGSFAFDAGQKAGAQRVEFDDSAFKAVSVPGDTQIQAGFTGVERWFETKDLIAVNQKEWWYRKHFHAGPKAAGTVSRIVFDGADYFATVWLNGQLLGSHEGTFTEFSFDVTDKLRYGADNVLAVVLTHPWIPKGRGLLEYMNGDFSMAYPGNLVEVKKPPYFIDVAWDALPAQGNAAFDMGIWRSIYLRTTAPVTIDDVQVETKQIDADGVATLHLAVTLNNTGQETATRTVSLKLTPDNFSGPAQDLPPLTITAAPGTSKAEAEVKVPHAQLWWSWDKGAQNLYRLEATTAAGKGQWGDRRDVTFGIRTITRDANMAYWLNGKKVFIKASWFSIEDFYRATPNAESYERDLRLYRDGNFNLLVNFTVVEKPEFYDLCDRLGILVVEELPFLQFGPQHIIDRDSPRREPYMKQARLQVSQIVTALRNHPSIVEWAPLAEAHEKAGEWGNGVDQKSYDEFMADMKAIITDLAPGSIFHPSLCDLGEQHFWTAAAGMIWEKEPYQVLFDAKTGFVSEYGGISLSSYENLGKYLTPAQQWGVKTTLPQWFNLPIDTTAYAYLTSFDSPGLYSMFFRTEHWIDRDPRTLPELVSDTQLYQGLILNYAAQAFRRKKYDPVNGIRSWNFLELGPGFRFGVVDYDRVPKTAYWLMKRSQAPVALSFAYKDALESQLTGSKWSAPVWLINDTDKEIKGTVHAELVAPNGEKVAATDFPASIAADSKGVVGDFSVTLPQTAGVYVLRATLTGSDAATETSFIKVVAPAFTAPHRVLLIAQSKAAAPIAGMLRAMGLTVDVYDQNSLDEMGSDLADGQALHAKYDVIWVGCFEALAKVLPVESAKAIAEAVKAGTGFVITGGEGSFHGGLGHAAVVEGTALDPILPVEIQGRSDLVYGAHWMDDALTTENPIREIATGSDATANGASPESYALLRHYGLTAFNQVGARSGAHIEMTIANQPLLVTGQYGAGRTAAFAGFTPTEDESTALPIDEYLIAEPQMRAYFVLFADLLSGVMPGTPHRAADLLAQHEKPLFQMLKEQPQTELAVTKLDVAPVAAEGGARSRVRLVNKGGYAHLVHMRFEWPQAGPKPFLAELGDNDFEMLPNETREIELSWRTSDSKQPTAGTLVANAANAPEVRLAF
jgi:beta-mannosidase